MKTTLCLPLNFKKPSSHRSPAPLVFSFKYSINWLCETTGTALAVAVMVAGVLMVEKEEEEEGVVVEEEVVLATVATGTGMQTIRVGKSFGKTQHGTIAYGMLYANAASTMASVASSGWRPTMHPAMR